MSKDSLNTYLRLFKELYEEFFTALVHYAYKYVNSWTTAEDIAQDVFIALWIKRNDIDFSIPIKSYLYRSIHNKSLNYLNSAIIKKRIDGKDTLDDLLNYEILNYNQSDPILFNDILKEISTCVQTLPTQCKKVFLLSRESNMKNKEISAHLKISEKAVEKHITKALYSIRIHLIRVELMPMLVALAIQNFLR